MLFPEVRIKPAPTFAIENRYRDQGFDPIAGVDEAGVGPLAGPVVAAAVVLPGKIPARSRLYQLRDSKLLSRGQRWALYLMLQEEAVDVAWSLCPPAEIDALNVFNARFKAMRQAVEALDPEPQLVLVDGNHAIPCRIPSVPVVKGDRQCLSIAAASVVAKVIRDQIMTELGRLYPRYGFERHKGYATAEHLQAVAAHGPCPVHRQSFQPIKDRLEGKSGL